MIKKIKSEIIILFVLFGSIFVSQYLDFKIFNHIANLQELNNNNYLKKFFINITEMGDSYWYFLFIAPTVIVLFFLKKINILKKNLKNIFNFFFFTLVCLLLSGFLVQILKHIIGRHRPNHTNFNELYNLNFFNLDSSFHSFPSGHATTIFVIALSLGLVVPRLKYFFIFISLVVGISRVIVGAHFLTDVLAGIVVAIISFKILNNILNKKTYELRPKVFSEINNSVFFLIIIIMLSLAILITVGPSLDMYFSSLFYLGENSFVLQSYFNITIFFRKILLPITLVYILMFPIFKKLISKRWGAFSYNYSFRDILYIWTSLFINIGLTINIILKSFWGRARPNDIFQLDGDGYFTPWYQISDSCNSNCSFVSGDAAVGFSMIAIYMITRNKYFLWLSVFLGLSLGTIRILEGGHFFSDVIFSGIIIFGLSFLLSKIFYINGSIIKI